MKQELGIVVDWETSGLGSYETPYRAYMEGPQGIEIGATLVNLPDFSVISEFSSLVRFIGKYEGVSYGGPIYEGLTWDRDAEKIHGFRTIDLMNAPYPADVAASFVKFVSENGKITDPHKTPIMFCGHNPTSDLYHTRQLLFFGGMEHNIRFHHRMIDSFSLGYMVLGTKSSNELFETTSGVKRNVHGALEDSRLTTAAFRYIYKLCQDTKCDD